MENPPEIGNFIRNKPSYQSNTFENGWAKKAVDYPISNAIHGNISEKCSHTSEYNEREATWFIVDLVNTYLITKVCLLNSAILGSLFHSLNL